MDRNKAKELSDILLAYSQGKLIQISNNGNHWVEWIATNPDSIFNYNYYRIKPKPKLVPFTFEDRDLFKDKWFRLKTTGGLFKASYIDGSLITIGASQNSYSELMQLFEFEDGSPCGKYINE